MACNFLDSLLLESLNALVGDVSEKFEHVFYLSKPSIVFNPFSKNALFVVFFIFMIFLANDLYKVAKFLAYLLFAHLAG